MSRVSRSVDRVEVIFDDLTLVANAGLVVPATLMARLGLEALINSTVRLVGRVGGALPGRKVLTLMATILAGVRTSITRTCCGPGRRSGCCRFG